jgi:hypothetical protein
MIAEIVENRRRILNGRRAPRAAARADDGDAACSSIAEEDEESAAGMGSGRRRAVREEEDELEEEDEEEEERILEAEADRRPQERLIDEIFCGNANNAMKKKRHRCKKHSEKGTGKKKAQRKMFNSK